jgi:hypothetical protein
MQLLQQQRCVYQDEPRADQIEAQHVLQTTQMLLLLSRVA